MLISLILNLMPQAAATLPGELGRANYAEVLGRLAAFDPELAAAIHDGDGPKPLTCSGILDSRGGASLTVRPDETYCVRVTGLTERASDGLRAALLDAPPACWSLGHHEFRLSAVSCDAQSDPWSGQTSYQELMVQAFRRRGRQPRKVTLDFVSPTAFRSQEMQVPVPMPAHVFGSLVERWNAHSPLPIDLDMRAFAEQCVAISRYRLESRPMPQKNGALRIGGVGQVTYSALDGDDEWFAAMNVLADFALFSGVGVQTATGMGQCRRTA